jgi:L-malate glycosyltransferase
MKIAVIMAMNSPWAKDAALRLCALNHEVHVANVGKAHQSKDYLSGLTSLWRANAATLHRHAWVHDLVPPRRAALGYLHCGRALRAICRKYGIDLVLALYGGAYATIAYASGFRPYVIYAVGSDVLLSRGIKKLVSRITFRSAAGIFANGVHLGERTRRFALRRDVESLYLGIDTERFRPGEEKSGVAILCPRGFLPVYNNEYLIQALALMPAASPFGEVLFSSAGPTLESVKSMANRILPAPVRQKVRFLCGVTDDELLGHLQRSSIFVSLSRSDGTSISLLEALACGLFPVLSDIPQNREWIDPTLGNGILVPLDRPGMLADALTRAIDDASLRANAAAINRQLVVERADGRTNIQTMASKLEQIVERHRPRLR